MKDAKQISDPPATQVGQIFFDFLEEGQKIAEFTCSNKLLEVFGSSLTNGKISAIKAEIFALRPIFALNLFFSDVENFRDRSFNSYWLR